MGKQRNAARDQINEHIYELVCSGLFRRSVVNEEQEHAEMSQPESAAYQATQVIGNRGLVKNSDELRNAPLADGRRLLAEHRQRVRSVSQISEQGGQQLSISAQQIQLGAEQRGELGSKIGVRWASCLGEPLVLRLHPLVVSHCEFILRSEVVVGGTEREPSTLRDISHRRALETASPEQLERSLENMLAGRFALTRSLFAGFEHRSKQE